MPTPMRLALMLSATRFVRPRMFREIYRGVSVITRPNTFTKE